MQHRTSRPRQTGWDYFRIKFQMRETLSAQWMKVQSIIHSKCLTWLFKWNFCR
jgi:hypothetical protein